MQDNLALSLAQRNILIRMLIYIRERFPVAVALVYSSLFAFCIAVFFYPTEQILNYKVVLVTATLFLFFFRLRLLDEIKDYQYDNIFHSDRPVARGVINIHTIKWLVVSVLILEIIIQSYNVKSGIILYVALLGYSLLIFKDFFVRKFLEQQMALKLLIHQLIFVGYTLFGATVITSKFFKPNSVSEFVFLIFMFIPPLLFELGRKLEHRYDSKGNFTDDTYIYRWGLKKAVAITITVAAIQLINLLILIGTKSYILIFPYLLSLVAVVIIYLINPALASRTGKRWTILLAILSLLTFLVSHFRYL